MRAGLVTLVALWLSVLSLGAADRAEVWLDAGAAPADTAAGRYATAREAFEAIRGTERATIRVTPGVYWLDDPDDERVAMPEPGTTVPFAQEVVCRHLEIVGVDPDAEATVMAVNRGQTQGAIGNFTMLHFRGETLKVENLTFGNYCNADLDYRRRPSLSRPKRNGSIVQAQIGICEPEGFSGAWSDYGSGTDTVTAVNCRFISRLNLCPLIGARRSYYTGCYFECTDDALTGTGFYRDCTFRFFSSKPFYSTAPTGAVFVNCDIHILTRGVQYLTKVPGMVTLIDTRFHSPDSRGRAEIRWTRDPSAVVSYQRGVTLDSRPYMVDSDRRDLWQEMPDGVAPGTMLRLAPGEARLQAEADTFRLSPVLIGWGGDQLPEAPRIVRWDFPDFLKIVDGRAVVSANPYPEEMEGIVYATTADGLRGGLRVKVAPRLTAAPKFVAPPTISADKAGRTLTLDYKLDTDNTDDRSMVTWSRIDPATGRAVEVVKGPVSLTRVYTLSRADRGRLIEARVVPQVYGSEPGEEAASEFGAQISRRHLGTLSTDTRSYSTDFSLVPISRRRCPDPDTWSFDAFKPSDTDAFDWQPDTVATPWYYGRGQDGAAGEQGLVQAVRGARCFYRPDRKECREASLSLLLYPAKPAGQGFGSATGQYMDCYFMFSPDSLSGYALRIERTPDHDRAVECRLVRLSGGEVMPLTAPQVTKAFRSPCLVEIVARDGLITARLSSSSPEAEGDAVSLKAPLDAGPHPAAVGIQHTGTTGGGATLVKRLEATWK